MPELVVMRGSTGKLEGFGEKGRRAWQKFVSLVGGMEPGEMLGFSYRLPRSPAHHKYVFVKLTALFDRQERFDDFDHFLGWLKVGAGHADLLPGFDGVPCAIPKSINWTALDEQGFVEFMRGVSDFLWTGHAQGFLWPHLDDAARYQAIESWHREFEAPSSRKVYAPGAEFPEVAR